MNVLHRSEAEESALSHGRWQCVIFIVGCVVMLVVLVVHPQIASADTSRREYLRLVRPWTTLVVIVYDLWALEFVRRMVRHRHALAAAPAVRGGFMKAAVVMIILPVLPGVLFWGWYGLPASVIGLGCLVAIVGYHWRAHTAK